MSHFLPIQGVWPHKTADFRDRHYSDLNRHLHGPFLLSYSVFVFSFPYFFVYENLATLTTVREREFWMICLRRGIWDTEFIVEIITVIKFGVNDRGSNGTGSWQHRVQLCGRKDEIDYFMASSKNADYTWWAKKTAHPSYSFYWHW